MEGKDDHCFIGSSKCFHFPIHFPGHEFELYFIETGRYLNTSLYHLENFHAISAQLKHNFTERLHYLSGEYLHKETLHGAAQLLDAYVQSFANFSVPNPDCCGNTLRYAIRDAARAEYDMCDLFLCNKTAAAASYSLLFDGNNSVTATPFNLSIVTDALWANGSGSILEADVWKANTMIDEYFTFFVYNNLTEMDHSNRSAIVSIPNFEVGGPSNFSTLSMNMELKSASLSSLHTYGPLMKFHLEQTLLPVTTRIENAMRHVEEMVFVDVSKTLAFENDVWLAGVSNSIQSLDFAAFSDGIIDDVYTAHVHLSLYVLIGLVWYQTFQGLIFIIVGHRYQKGGMIFHLAWGMSLMTFVFSCLGFAFLAFLTILTKDACAGMHFLFDDYEVIGAAPPSAAYVNIVTKGIHHDSDFYSSYGLSSALQVADEFWLPPFPTSSNHKFHPYDLDSIFNINAMSEFENELNAARPEGFGYNYDMVQLEKTASIALAMNRTGVEVATVVKSRCLDLSPSAPDAVSMAQKKQILTNLKASVIQNYVETGEIIFICGVDFASALSNRTSDERFLFDGLRTTPTLKEATTYLDAFAEHHDAILQSSYANLTCDLYGEIALDPQPGATTDMETGCSAFHETAKNTDSVSSSHDAHHSIPELGLLLNPDGDALNCSHLDLEFVVNNWYNDVRNISQSIAKHDRHTNMGLAIQWQRICISLQSHEEMVALLTNAKSSWAPIPQAIQKLHSRSVLVYDELLRLQENGGAQLVHHAKAIRSNDCSLDGNCMFARTRFNNANALLCDAHLKVVRRQF